MKVWGTEGMCAPLHGADAHLPCAGFSWHPGFPRAFDTTSVCAELRPALGQACAGRERVRACAQPAAGLRKCLADRLTCYRSIFVAVQACRQDGCVRWAKSPPPPEGRHIACPAGTHYQPAEGFKQRMIQ